MPIAAVLLWTWWSRYSPHLEIPDSHRGLLTLGLMGMPVAVLLQIIRTGAMFRLHPREAVARLWRPVLGAHSINTLGPGLGDLFEIWRVSAGVQRPLREVVATLMLRMVTTVAALLILAALAIGPMFPLWATTLTFVAVLGPVFCGATWPIWHTWVTLPGVLGPARFRREAAPWWEMLGHTLLAIVQALVEAAGYFCISRAVAEPLTVLASLGVVSLVELNSNMTHPIAGAGLHHWGAVGAAVSLDPAGGLPATTTALHHMWVLAVGGVAGALALLTPRSKPDAPTPDHHLG